MLIQKSTRAGKRYMATFSNGKKVHFGQLGGKTFIDHGNIAKRAAYLARHKANEDWRNPYSPGALSRFLLWGDSQSLAVNHQAFMRRFPV